MGAILKKSVDWSDTDTLLPGEIIVKAIVSLQIPKVLSKEDTSAFMQKIGIGKSIVSFQPSEFIKVYKYFYAKKIESKKRLYCFKP